MIAKKLTEEQEKFYLKWGPVILGLQAMPSYQMLSALEDDVLNDLKTELSSVNISDPQYGQKMAYMHGMVDGIRRKKSYFSDIVDKYKQITRSKNG